MHTLSGLLEASASFLLFPNRLPLAIFLCMPDRTILLLQFLRKLAPPSDPYLHNDLHLREAPADWPGGWQAWWVWPGMGRAVRALVPCKGSGSRV